MGDDNKIQLGQIYAQGFDVVLEGCRIVASVKQYALPLVLDESRESPVLRDVFGIREGIVEDGDAVLCVEHFRQQEQRRSRYNPPQEPKRGHRSPPELSGGRPSRLRR